MLLYKKIKSKVFRNYNLIENGSHEFISENLDCLDQTTIFDHNFNKRIIGRKCDSSYEMNNPHNKYLNYTIEKYDGYDLIRFPSLRKVCTLIKVDGKNR